MKSLLRVIVCIAFVSLLVVPVVQSEESFDELSFEDMFFMESTIASKKALTSRETPSVVTIITKEDIKKSGARDILEVLTLFIPSVNFGADVEGVVGIGIRGMWAHEGKLLMMIDGQECNEEQFATTQFGNHYPVENIEKVEVIRGPGSAIYGGYAGVGVINIITKGASQNGGYVSMLYSQMKESYSHRNLAVGYGKEASEDLSYSVNAVLSQGARSDRDNLDYYGDAMSMKDASELNITNLNANIKYAGLDVRAIVDQYKTTQIDLWDVNYAPGAVAEDFISYFYDVKYDVVGLADGLTVTPEVKYKIQYPWQLITIDQGYTNEKRAEKMQFGFSAMWDVNENTNLVFGVEQQANSLHMPDTYDANYEEEFKTGSDVLEQKNSVIYAQLIENLDIGNITVGGRMDNSDEYGSSFVPRLGWTKIFGEYHAKVLYSQSFRVPGGIIPNRIPVGLSGVTPETANNIEVELGCLVNENMSLVGNIFSTTFEKVIVYQSDPTTGIGSYYNSGKLGTQGLEAELKYKKEGMDLLVNYSFSQVSENTVDSYKVPGEDKYALAFPAHRLNLLFGTDVADGISIHPSLSFFGKRYGYQKYDNASSTQILKLYDATMILNLNLTAKDLLGSNSSLDFGLRNLLDTEYDYIQPYDGWHSPLPSPTRSIYVRTSFNF